MVTRVCKICGKEYDICPTCEQIRTFTPWRRVVCDAKEFIIYTTLSKYDLDKDAKEAVESFDNLGLTKKEIRTFIPAVRKSILDIYKANEIQDV